MKQNIGNLDRAIRLLITLIIGILYLEGYLSGITATILILIGIALALTSLIKFCPLYIPFKISTIKKLAEKNDKQITSK